MCEAPAAAVREFLRLGFTTAALQSCFGNQPDRRGMNTPITFEPSKEPPLPRHLVTAPCPISGTDVPDLEPGEPADRRPLGSSSAVEVE